MPALALAPLATGVAFARQISGEAARSCRGCWPGRSRAASRVCSRWGSAPPSPLRSGVPFRGALVGASLGALIAGPLVYVVTRSVERRFFPAVTEYKPTIEQLSEELTSINDPAEVALAVERTVRRWLPCERVAFRRRRSGATSARRRARTRAGRRPGRTQHPCLVRRPHPRLALGGQKRGGALFTSDDVDLLSTIGNQAGLALAHAHSYAELERRRQQQAAAWQIERLALVETVAAEIAHEVRYPINFFRSVFRATRPTRRWTPRTSTSVAKRSTASSAWSPGLRRMVGHRIDRRVDVGSDLPSAPRCSCAMGSAAAGSRSSSRQTPPSAATRSGHPGPRQPRRQRDRRERCARPHRHDMELRRETAPS